jgi:antitoxin (DNA-binding transcriptional repressor) of toxin-antitoxin stability system
MLVVHMSEAEVVRDISAVLAKVRQGTEVVIEQGNRPIAVIKPSTAGRIVSDVLADLKARGAQVTMDADFARDIEEGINSHFQPRTTPAQVAGCALRRQPWNPPSWE